VRDRLLQAVAALAVRRSGAVVAVAVALACVGAALATTRLELDSNQDSLVSTDLPHHARYMAFVEEFGDLEDLYVVVPLEPDPAAARRFALDVASALEGLEGITNVHARLRPEDLGDKLLLLAPEAELARLEAGVARARGAGAPRTSARTTACWRAPSTPWKGGPWRAPCSAP
jgi:hypothetical protein